MSCVFDADDPLRSPYVYKYANNTEINMGVKASNGVCIFATDACSLTNVSCCGNAPKLGSAASIWYIPLLSFAVPYVLFQIWQRYCKKGDEEQQEEDGHRPFREGRTSKSENPMVNAPTPNSEHTAHVRSIPLVQAMMFGGMSGCQKTMVMVVFVGAIFALVMESSIMPKYTPTAQHASL